MNTLLLSQFFLATTVGQGESSIEHVVNEIESNLEKKPKYVLEMLKKLDIQRLVDKEKLGGMPKFLSKTGFAASIPNVYRPAEAVIIRKNSFLDLPGFEDSIEKEVPAEILDKLREFAAEYNARLYLGILAKNSSLPRPQVKFSEARKLTPFTSKTWNDLSVGIKVFMWINVCEKFERIPTSK